MRDVATSTVAMNWTSSCTRLSTSTIRENTDPSWNSTKTGTSPSITGGTAQPPLMTRVKNMIIVNDELYLWSRTNLDS